MPGRSKSKGVQGPDPIAIIGAAARLPGASDLAAYADMLRGGVVPLPKFPMTGFRRHAGITRAQAKRAAVTVLLPAQLAISGVLTRKPSAFPRVR